MSRISIRVKNARNTLTHRAVVLLSTLVAATAIAGCVADGVTEPATLQDGPRNKPRADVMCAVGDSLHADTLVFEGTECPPGAEVVPWH